MKGIRQGSVLSPLLFLMVTDPLLQQLVKSALEPSINNLYVGGFLHADDIRTLDLLDAQVSLVHEQTNVRCMVVFASDPHARYPECKTAEQAISVGSEGKFLGFWWQGNLMANRRASRKPEEALFIMVQLVYL